MNRVPDTAAAFWAQFRASPGAAGDADARFYECFRVGQEAADADAGARLIRSGVKTATSSLLWEYEASDRPPPAVGSLSIVEDGGGRPVCVVETVGIEIRSFSAVDARFAWEYGEGDRTLEGWRAMNRAYYAQVCRRLGRAFTDDAPLVCEWLAVRHP